MNLRTVIVWIDGLARSVLLFGGCFITLAVAGFSGAAAADDKGQLVVKGVTRSYVLHVPAATPPSDGFPVIMVFHGGGGRGASIQKLTKLDDLADARGFIAVYPDGVDKHWNDGRSTIKNPQDDVGFVAALLDRLAANYAIDRHRVFAAGISDGALFSERVGCELSDRFAGIAAVAGSLPVDLVSQCHPAKAIAVLQISGNADPIMPFAGGKVADFGGLGEGGRVLSVKDTLDFWSQHNGCASAGVEQPLAPVAMLDRTRVTRMSYTGCPAASPVTLETIEQGGHAWPGGAQYAPAFIIGKASRQIDASLTMVDFFLSLPVR